MGKGDATRNVMYLVRLAARNGRTIGIVHRHVGIELIAHRKHKVGQYREFEQAKPPVLLVLTGVEILCLATERYLGRELILTFGYKDVTLNRIVAMTLYHALIIGLERIHKVHFELLGKLFVYLNVDIAVVQLFPILKEVEEVRLIAIRPHEFALELILVLVDSTDFRNVHLHIRTILAS